MMAYRIRRALILAFLVSAPAAAKIQTVFLVRHAEKAAEPAADPALSATGMRRAEALAALLANAKPAAIFVSQYRRTQMTAVPLADLYGIGLTIVPVDKAANDYPRQLLARICALPADASAVVIGHSNTIPAIAEAWTALPARPIADDEYNRILIIRLKECIAMESLDLRY